MVNSLGHVWCGVAATRHGTQFFSCFVETGSEPLIKVLKLVPHHDFGFGPVKITNNNLGGGWPDQGLNLFKNLPICHHPCRPVTNPGTGLDC